MNAVPEPYVNRWQYALYTFGVGLVLELIMATTYYDEFAFVLLILTKITAFVYLTVLRCRDMQINEWWAAAIIVPFAWFYFALKRGESYYRKHGRKQ